MMKNIYGSLIFQSSLRDSTHGLYHTFPGSELPGYNRLSLRDENDVLIGFSDELIPQTWLLHPDYRIRRPRG